MSPASTRSDIAVGSGRAILFDMDGVLVLTADAHFEAWRAMGAKHGVDVTRQAFDRSFGRTNPDCVRMLIDPDPSDALVRAIAEEKEAMYRDLVRAAIPLAPGTLRVLTRFRETGFRLAIGSSAPRENLDMILDGASIRGFFDAVVDASMVTRGKPAPDVFLAGARRLGIDPARCTVIEDAPAGIQAARAAGMEAVGIATTHEAGALLEAGARIVLAALSDLDPSLVDGQNRR